MKQYIYFIPYLAIVGLTSALFGTVVHLRSSYPSYTPSVATPSQKHPEMAILAQELLATLQDTLRVAREHVAIERNKQSERGRG